MTANPCAHGPLALSCAGLSCGVFGRKRLSGVQRPLSRHRDISDEACQPMRMARFSDALHIKRMSSLNVPLRIFIADDSPLIRERVAAMLCARAMAIVGQAETPQDAIEGILALYPDVVVLDAQLQGGSGLQVLRAVRHTAPDIAFVVFSNSADTVYRESYRAAGAEQFVDKTHDFDLLAQAVVSASRHPHIDVHYK